MSIITNQMVSLSKDKLFDLLEEVLPIGVTKRNFIGITVNEAEPFQNAVTLRVAARTTPLLPETRTVTGSLGPTTSEFHFHTMAPQPKKKFWLPAPKPASWLQHGPYRWHVSSGLLSVDIGGNTHKSLGFATTGEMAEEYATAHATSSTFGIEQRLALVEQRLHDLETNV